MRPKLRIIVTLLILLHWGSVPPILYAQRAPQGKDIKSLQSLSNALEALSLSVGPAVVRIFASGYAPSSTGEATSSGLISRERSSGSGVLLGSDGYIVTNGHVVAGANRLQVLLAFTIYDSLERRSILKPRGKLAGAQIVGIALRGAKRY